MPVAIIINRHRVTEKVCLANLQIIIHKSLNSKVARSGNQTGGRFVSTIVNHIIIIPKL